MKKALKISLRILLSLVAIMIITLIYFEIKWSSDADDNLALLGVEAPMLESNGFQYRDLNKNGRLDTYEDSRIPDELRIEDLLGQMNVKEKAGMMFITMIGMNEDGTTLEKPFFSTTPLNMMMSVILPKTADMVAKRKMNHFNTVQSLPARMMARWNNNIQKMAERTRLGIPVTIATDPRHGPGNNPGAVVATDAFSSWPTSLGLAATRDTTLVKEFGDIARREYLSVGIRLALHPMADLATEPRWGRINGTFGEDAELSAMMTKAYVLGFQGDSLGNQSVACMTKHFSGGGPQLNGEDPHFPYGKEQAYPGSNFDYHLIPFEKGAFPAKTAQIMPYYGIPVGQTSEDVAFAFNKEIITGLLREKYQFDGVVCTDWAIIGEDDFIGTRPWGVENLTPLERAQKVIEAGCDQFGGEDTPDLIVELVEKGMISEERIDISIRRLLRDKFRLGLFDNPYVDEEQAELICGRDDFVEKGKQAQRKSTVLLKNDNILPLEQGTKIYIEGIDPSEASKYGEVVDSPSEADVVITRLQTPYSKRDDYFLEQFFHQGRLYFNEEEKSEIFELINEKPAIVGITLERPALIPEIADASSALLADFGTEDDVFLDAIFGKFNPTGKLPFEMPSSQEAIEKQLEDVPYDSENPLYPFGHGLSYELITELD